jgi:phage baseplate assembly protein gpV
MTNRYGCWGVVQAVNSTSNSVDVYLDTGIFVGSVPVSSKEWVKVNTEGQKYVSGERNLPPEDSRVFIMMPSGTIDSAFVLCSGFSIYETPHVDAFMAKDDSEKEKKDPVRQRVLPGNWKTEYNHDNGTAKVVSPDEKTSFLLDYEPSDPELHLSLFDETKIDAVSGKDMKITCFDTVITIKDGEISINVPKSDVKVSGDASIEVSGNANVKATKTTVTGNVEINGGDFSMKGNVPPTGSGPLCAIVVCPFTGAPHSGPQAKGT